MKSINQKRIPRQKYRINIRGLIRQNLKEASGGFTIIEVVLFLALSGAFMGIAFVGIQGRTAAVQFTDSMRSLQSFIVSEQNKVINGVNSTTTSACSAVRTGTNEKCFLLGRVITFGAVKDAGGVTLPSEVEVAVLRGEKPPSGVPDAETDLEAIENYKPAPDATKEKYTISWGTEFIPSRPKTVDLTNAAVSLHSIGWIRSPISARIIPVAFTRGVDLNTVGQFNDFNSSIRIDTDVYARLCFRGAGGQTASIVFGEEDSSGDVTGSANVVLKFDQESGCL